MNKKVIENIMLSVLTFILIIYIVFGLIFFCFFNISKKFLNKDNVYNFISSADITSILKDDFGNELKEFTLIKEDFVDLGISVSELNEFVNSDDIKEFSVDVVTNVLNKVTNKRDIDYKINVCEN